MKYNLTPNHVLESKVMSGVKFIPRCLNEYTYLSGLHDPKEIDILFCKR